jgi:RNA-dependent RNA polymerase
VQTQQLTKAIRSEFLRGTDSKSTDNEGWDSDDDSDDEDSDRQVKVETLKRAWAAWNAAEDTLNDDPEAFGPLSFGIIALGTILEIIKKLRMDSEYY